MAISFDGPTKLITLSSGTVVLNVKDLWSRAVDWWVTGDNSKFQFPFEQLGGNDIDPVSGTTVPIYIFQVGGWKIRPQEANHTLSVTDGILVDATGDPFVNTLGSYVVRINYQQPVQAITVSTGGGGGATPAQIAAAVRTELTPELTSITSMQTKVDLATAILKNKTVTDPSTGLMTVYDTDGVTPLLNAQLYENVSGTQTYRGQGAERREALA